MKVYADTISLKRRDGTLDLDSVFALREVSTTKFLLHSVKDRPVKNLAFAKTNLFERILERIGFKVFVAVETDARDRRSLIDDDD